MSRRKHDSSPVLTLPSLANVSAGFALFRRVDGENVLVRKDLVMAAEALKSGGCTVFVSFGTQLISWHVDHTLHEVSDRLRSVPNNYPGV